MRKILWYRADMSKKVTKEDDSYTIPVYYTGPWWAFLIRGILWNWGSNFTDWAMTIEGKYLEPEDKEA